MPIDLKSHLRGKYIICSCEGSAEKAIIDLLLDNDKLCFRRNNIIDGESTNLRGGQAIADEFLNREYDHPVAILRILDKANEKFVLPLIYRKNNNIEHFNVVTKPEIEIIHVYSEGLISEYQKEVRKNKSLKPSEFCKAYIKSSRRKSISNIKSADFIKELYEQDIEKLVNAIMCVKERSKGCYILQDLLI